MKNKLLQFLILIAFAFVTFVRAQTEILPSPTPMSSAAVPSASNRQMAGMDSMNQMAEMCREMMKSEKAAMPFIISASVLFGLLLLTALILLIVLEVLWIRYWVRILKQPQSQRTDQITTRSARVE